MGRDELDEKAVEKGGFVKYDKKMLDKVNQMRRDKSQPDFYGVPILSDGQAMFVRASAMNNEPASCYNCDMQQSDKTCHLLGPGVKVEKVSGNKEDKAITYWPCCGMHNYGHPQSGKPSYSEHLSTPDELGLVWINGDSPDKQGGANCGGLNGGDDCDYYIVHGTKEKWEVASAYCKALAHEVAGGDVCAVWHDDDELYYPEAEMLRRGDSVDSITKKRLARSIMKRDTED